MGGPENSNPERVDPKRIPKRILVARPDRLGDVILSTPVLSALRRAYPEAKLSFLIQKPFFPLFQGMSECDELLDAGLEPKALRQELRARDFDVAVVLQSKREVSQAIWRAGVRERIGPLSKLHTYLFFNRGLRQRRSQVAMHEADYNLELLKPLGIEVKPRELPVKIGPIPGATDRALQWLHSKGYTPARPLVAVHPGMGGSALNWPEKNYVELVRRLLREGLQVVVTAGPTEGEILERVRAGTGGRRESPIFFGPPETRPPDFLAGLYSACALVVAPSTGPLHLASALGRKLVSFYPTIAVQSPERWGPYVANADLARVLVPDADSDMNSISVERALRACQIQLGL